MFPGSARQPLSRQVLSRTGRTVSCGAPQRHSVGPHHRPVRPLALSLDAEMVVRLTEGHLHLPALDGPAYDLQRATVRIGAEQGLRVETALGGRAAAPTRHPNPSSPPPEPA